MKLKTAIVAGLALNGCVTATYNYQPPSEYFAIPIVGEEAAAPVGNSLIAQGSVTKWDGMLLNEQVRTAYGSIVINPGFYKKSGETERAIFFSPGDFPGSIGNMQIGMTVSSQFHDDARDVVFYKKSGKICAVDPQSIELCPALKAHPHDHEMKNVEEIEYAPLQQLLVYNGIQNGKISLTYREALNDEPLPNTDISMEFDLSPPQEITFRNARISVISANDTEIVYRVLQHLDG